MNSLLLWITEHEEELRNVTNARELTALLAESGLAPDPDQLRALADQLEAVTLEEEELAGVAGGVYTERPKDLTRVLTDLLYRSWEGTDRAGDLVYRGLPAKPGTLEGRTGKNTPLSGETTAERL